MHKVGDKVRLMSPLVNCSTNIAEITKVEPYVGYCCYRIDLDKGKKQYHDGDFIREVEDAPKEPEDDPKEPECSLKVGKTVTLKDWQWFLENRHLMDLMNNCSFDDEEFRNKFMYIAGKSTQIVKMGKYYTFNVKCNPSLILNHHCIQESVIMPIQGFKYPEVNSNIEVYNGSMSGNLSVKPDALSVQVGGNHYKDLVIQPVEYCEKNHLGFCVSSAIKYLSRYKFKNGEQDLDKAIHFIEILKELEYPKK